MEYVRLVMCRDVYHCTPTELEKVPWRTIQEDLVMIGIEHTIRERRAKK